MSFTQILTCLLHNTGPLSKTESDALSVMLLEELALVLKREMKQRGIWTIPPSSIGIEYLDWKNWGQKEALENLACHCYEYIMPRFPNFITYLNRGHNIDALIRTNIKHFLTEKQKKGDPIGYAVAGNVKAAVQESLQNNMMFAHPENSLGNNTVLTCSKTPDIPIDKSQLRKIIHRFQDWGTLRLQLVQQNQKARKKLTEILSQLSKYGILSVQYGDLMKIIKEDCRQEWQALGDPEETVIEYQNDDTAQRVHLVQADTSHDDWKEWHSLRQRILNQIEEQHQSQKNVRTRISILFTELAVFIEADEPIPSQVELTRVLKDIYPNNNHRLLNRDMKYLRNLNLVKTICRL